MNRKELEFAGCKSFCCPNIDVINENCKKMGLNDNVTKRARYIAVDYLKRTYHNPLYAGIGAVLNGAICLASILEGQYITPYEMYQILKNLPSNGKRGHSQVSIKKWVGIIVKELDIDIQFVDDYGNFIKFKYGDEIKTVSFDRDSIERSDFTDVYRSIYSLDILKNK